MSGNITRILLLCTANQCRSPFAAAIATQNAVDLPVQFESAGLIEGGHPMPMTGIRVASEFGLDLASHFSQQLDFSVVRDYDVILTMTREQAREIAVADPEVWPRLFTLKQFSRWLGEHPFPANGSLRDWLDVEAGHRTKSDLLGTDAGDDIRDPLRSPARIWRSVARELQEHLRIIQDAVFYTDAT